MGFIIIYCYTGFTCNNNTDTDTDADTDTDDWCSWKHIEKG